MALFPLFHYLIFAIFNFYLISQFWALRLSSGGYFKFNVNRKMLKCQNYKNPSWTFLTECYIQRRSILRPILHPFGSKILQNYFNNPKASTKWEMDTVEGWRSAFLETRGQALFVRGGVSLLAKLEGKPHLSGSSNVTRTWRRKSYKKKKKKKAGVSMLSRERSLCTAIPYPTGSLTIFSFRTIAHWSCANFINLSRRNVWQNMWITRDILTRIEFSRLWLTPSSGNFISMQRRSSTFRRMEGFY